MGHRIKYNDDLGQHMTPDRIARLLCRELPRGIGAAVDFAVGHGDLLAPLRERWPNICLHGIDCDPSRLEKAAFVLGVDAIALGDGLTAPLPAYMRHTQGRFLVSVNPPFVPVTSGTHQDLLHEAFPSVTSKHGLRRLEMAFFSRALIEARARSGWVAIIMPSAFCSGLQYAAYRKDLLERYGVVKAIEIREGRFRDTEAITSLLIIDANQPRTRTVQIGSYDPEHDRLTLVHHGRVRSDQRLDATFWSAAHLHAASSPTLGEVGVDIKRGVRSRAEAARARDWVLHTTDLCRHSGHSIVLRDARGCEDQDVYAEPGDILLPRTGTRVRWEPVVVARGRAPISDHVLRIRTPHGYRNAVKRSFRHPNFETWLRSVSKGVCATVLTKHELLGMPLFALA